MNNSSFPPRPRTFGPRGPRFRRPEPEEAHRINHRIVAREVRVIGENGEQLGILPVAQAIAAAERADLDLVEVAPGATPPVCRIMDYGKFKYREQKKEAEAKKKRTESTLKEIRLRYNTDIGDMETKQKQARAFLAEGDKVKFSMRFRGREAAHISLGAEKFEQIIENLKDVAIIDERSPVYGKQIHIVLAPAKQAGKPAAKPSAKPSQSDSVQ